MAFRFRLLFLPVLSVTLLFCSKNNSFGLDGIREVELNLKGLAYDPFTQKLYGSATNSLLQIAPESGQVLASFPLGTNVTVLSLGAEHGLWAGISGEHAVRRFNLQTLQAEDKIEYPLAAPIFDVAASKTDSQTVVFSTYGVIGKSYGTVFVLRDGVVLPDVYLDGDFLQLEGNALFVSKLTRVPGDLVGDLLRLTIGPSGVITDGYKENFYARQFQVLGQYVYSSFFQSFKADTLELVSPFAANAESWLTAVAKNETDSSIYFLTAGVGARLRRFAHPSFKLTGFADLPGITPDSDTIPYLTPYGADTSTRMVSWGTNHVAFFATGKLFLLDTAKLFLPSDLEVTQEVSSGTAFGSPIDFNVTIRNKGAGAALAITATNRTSSGLITLTAANVGLSPADSSTIKFDPLNPGNSVTYKVSVIPTNGVALTNWVDVSTDNDGSLANNQSVAIAPLVQPKPPVVALGFTPKAMAYNAANGRIYFLENLGLRTTYTPYGTSGSLIWSVDPETLNIAGGAATAFGFAGTDLLDASGSVFAAGDSALVSISPDTLQAQPGVPVGHVLYDMAVSPVDTNLVFISDETGSRLYKSGTSLSKTLSLHARADFSSDGSTLYAVDQDTCALSTYNVASDGLTLVQSFGTVGCSDFKAANGFLYFNSGIIVDASSGLKLTNSPSLSAPSFVLPRTNGVLDIVTRVSGVWSVRRVDSKTLQEVRVVTIGQIDGSPTQAVPAGANRVAIRTSGFGLYLVDLDATLLAGTIALGNNGSATIVFDTVPGQRYRVERADSLGTGTWSPLGVDFVADGSSHTESIPINQAKTSFFRLVRVP